MSNPPTLKLQFLLEFRSPYLGNIGKLKKYVGIQNISFKSRNFWGDVPQNFEPGGHVPLSPGGGAHACRVPSQDINGSFLRQYAHVCCLLASTRTRSFKVCTIVKTNRVSGTQGPRSTEPDWPSTEALPRLTVSSNAGLCRRPRL